MAPNVEALYLNKEIFVGNDIEIKVGVKYSKFLSLSKGSVSVYFNQRQVERVIAEIGTIKKSMVDGKSFRVDVSQNKHVGTCEKTVFDDPNTTAKSTEDAMEKAPYYMEWVNQLPKPNRVVMSLGQLQEFVVALPTIREWFNASVIYRHPEGNNWCLHPDQARDGLPDIQLFQCWRKLVPRPCMRCISFFLMAFAVRTRIERIAGEECFGCRNNKGSQRDHMEQGCLSPIEDLLVYYEQAEREVKFSDLMKRLTLELSWPYSRLPSIPSPALTQEVIAGSVDVLCEPCRPLQTLYDELFAYLNFDKN